MTPQGRKAAEKERALRKLIGELALCASKLVLKHKVLHGVFIHFLDRDLTI
jgi:hypothetical protein